MRFKKAIISAAVIGGVVLAAGAAYAAIPGANGVIQGCYNTTTGVLRVVEQGTACRSGESPLTWNQTGPQGPQGAPGVPGPSGQPGSSDAYFGQRFSSIPLTEPGVTLVTLQLPAGQYMVLATTGVSNQYAGDSSVGCWLISPNDPLFGDNAGHHFDPGEGDDLTLQGALLLPEGGSVSLGCATYQGFAYGPKLSAIKVGQIHS